MTPRLISFLFALDTERGHLFAYNKTVGEAVRQAGWEHAAAVRAAARVAERPPGWNFCLGTPRPRFGWRPMQLVEKLWTLFTSLQHYLNAQATQPRPLILFLEWFDLVHILPFCLALWCMPRREAMQVWVLYRLEVRPGWQNWYLHLLHAIVRRKLGAPALRLLSDSEVVAETMHAVFGLPVTLMPIPHTEPPAATPPARASAKLVLWFPGLAMLEKGSDIAQRLAGLATPEAAQCALAITDNITMPRTPGGCEVIALPPVLPRADYLSWMHTADLVALPYDPNVYAARTSGIFVEAITAGRMPLTTAGTWMAHELMRHNLPELIVDWAHPNVWGVLLALHTDATVRAKLAAMRAAYAQFHTVPSFARVAQTVWEQA